MKVPEQIQIRIDCKSEPDLSGFIVELTVKAGRKNPYRIYFPLTDYRGVARLKRDDFLGQFTDHWEGGLMDHDGSLDTADPIVQVALYDPQWSIENGAAALAWPLLKHERTKWASREEEYRHRTSTRNMEFVASRIDVDLQKTCDIVLPVRRIVNRY
jgi:hypothetical protein